jgi:hypothetical protein
MRMKNLLKLLLILLVVAAPGHATVTTETSRLTYTGASSTATYSYTFKIFNADDLDVIVRDTSNVDTTLTRTTHYTVTGAGTAAGGTVVLVNGGFAWQNGSGYLTTGYKITIRRKLDQTQATSITNQGAYYPSLHERAFDRLTMFSLQQQDELDRTMKVPWGDTVVDLTLPLAADRASGYLAFDSTGKPAISTSAVTGTPASTFWADLMLNTTADASLTVLGFSTFIKTLIDDTTALAARTTLGATAGVWPASLGGTGVANNDAATLTRSGSHALTLTTTGATNLTLPTSGTVATVGVALPSLGGTGVANNDAATLTRSGNHAVTLTTTGTTNLTLPTSGTLLTTSSLLPVNIIRNGGLDVWQRGVSFAGVTSTQKAADGFSFLNLQATGGVVSLLRSTDVPTVAQSGYASSYSLHVDVTTADSSIATDDLYEVIQAVEGYDYAQLYGKTGTLSFWVKSTKTGTFCVNFEPNVGGGGDSYIAEYTVNATNTWELKTISVNFNHATTPNLTNSVGLYVRWVLAAGASHQNTANSWLGAGYKATSNQVNAMDNTANDFKLAQIMFNAGPTAQAFTRSGGSIQAEIQRLQRYYEKSYDIGVDPATVTTVGAIRGHQNTAAQYHTISFKVPKRTAPTCTLYNPNNGSSAQWYDGAGPANLTMAAASDIGLNEFNTRVSAGGTDGQQFQGHWACDADI